MRKKPTSIALFFLLFTILGLVLAPIIVVAPIREKEAQWIQNSDFEDSEGWIPIVDADGNDLAYSINNGMANYIINGQEITFSPLSGTPTNTTAPYWYNSTNSRIDAYPTLGFELNETGFHASHRWDEHNGSIYNADQKVSVQWEKVINMPHNMADYNITSASLEMMVNATVKEEVGYGIDDYGGYGGIDVYGDDDGPGWSITEGDYVKFYAIVADPEQNISFTVATYINKSLGRDEGLAFNHTDELFDTVFSPENMYDFIFYINQVLKGNNRNFTLILGMEFNCEDNSWSTLTSPFIITKQSSPYFSRSDSDGYEANYAIIQSSDKNLGAADTIKGDGERDILSNLSDSAFQIWEDDDFHLGYDAKDGDYGEAIYQSGGDGSIDPGSKEESIVTFFVPLLLLS